MTAKHHEGLPRQMYRGPAMVFECTRNGPEIDAEWRPAEDLGVREAPAQKGTVKLAFYYELRDARKRLLFRGSQHDPTGMETEVYSLKDGQLSVGRVPTQERAIRFRLVVPFDKRATEVWIYSHAMALHYNKNPHRAVAKLPVASRPRSSKS